MQTTSTSCTSTSISFRFPLFRPMAGRTVTTLHGRQDLPGFATALCWASPKCRSSRSRTRSARQYPMRTFRHRLSRPAGQSAPARPVHPRGGYLAFLGRISPEKRLDRAIAIARAFGIPLKIAAKVDKVDEAYFRETVIDRCSTAPASSSSVRSTSSRRREFLGEARALLFPIDWPEPFGLVMIEAMACGTPVLAFRCGSVPEIIEDGVTGAIVETMDEAVALYRPSWRSIDRRCVSASSSGSPPHAWPRTMLTFTVRCSAKCIDAASKNTQVTLRYGKDANILRPTIA